MTDGSVWMIHTPPSNCSYSANWNGMAKMNTSAPALITSETIFAIWLSSASVQVGMDELAIDVAGEGVRRGDRHDGRRHQRADRDGGERHADEPGREHRQEQRRDREVVAVALEAVGELRHRLHADRDRHEADQRQQPQHQRIGRQHRRIAPHHAGARCAQDAGDRVRIQEQRTGRAERQCRIGAEAAQRTGRRRRKQKFGDGIAANTLS